MAFSTKQYSWADITVSIGGRVLTGVKELEYKETKEKEYLYGRGSKPHAIVHGNHSYEGKLMLWQSELEALTKDAPDNDITNLNLNITIAYTPSDNDDEVVVDIIEGAEFTENSKSMSQGDTSMEVEMPIMFINVKRQQ